MDEDIKISLIAFFIVMFLGGIVAVGAMFYSHAQCQSKWSSFPNQWALIKGCQIEVGGKWIPAESYYFKQE
jgi:hypothetical protein